MTIEELIILLNNRLNSFKLVRDYARMNGDLEAMNAADKEIAGIQATLYKINPLAEHTVAPAVVDATATELPSSVGAEPLAFYDITSYATDPLHEAKVAEILSAIGEMKTAADIEAYIQGKYPGSPVTGQMILNAAVAEEVDARLMMAIMEQDSRFGTVGLAVSTINPGNVGNDDAGNTQTYDSWQEGVTAVAEWLSRHRAEPATLPPLTDPLATSTPPVATTTPPVIEPIATSTPPMIEPVATSTPPVVSEPAATSTPPVVPEISAPLVPVSELTVSATSSPTATDQSSMMSTTTPTQ
jgi:hypothetical protein